MAEWPTLDAVKLQLGVNSSEKDAIISQGLAAAIEQVAVDVGYTDIVVAIADPPTAMGTFDEEEDIDIPVTASLSQAAMILAVMSVKAPDAPFGVAAVFDTGGLRVAAQHPTYLRMLTGQRLSFGIG